VKPVINLADVALEHHAHGDTFAAGDGSVGARIGAKQLGSSLIVVPPGKRAYPFHCHHANERLFVILEGSGILRFGKEEYPVRKHDVISTPAGGRGTAHQLINTSETEELRYLAISTMVPYEVVEYPDSDKVAVSVGGAPGEDPAKRTFFHRGRLGPKLDYWEGE